MVIYINMDNITFGKYPQIEGLMTYEARITTPNKFNTQTKLEKILESNNKLTPELKDTGELYEFYLNKTFISNVLKSKYKGVKLRMKNLHHIDLLVEKQKSGLHKVTPIIYSEIPDQH